MNYQLQPIGRKQPKSRQNIKNSLNDPNRTKTTTNNLKQLEPPTQPQNDPKTENKNTLTRSDATYTTRKTAKKQHEPPKPLGKIQHNRRTSGNKWKKQFFFVIAFQHSKKNQKQLELV